LPFFSLGQESRFTETPKTFENERRGS